MKNNFQSNGKGRSQRVWQLLISMLIILTMGIGQMWATDITVTPPTPNNASNPFSTGLYVMSISGTGSKLSSGAITTSTNGAVITINFQATKSDMYIKTITFNSLGNGTLSSDDGTFDGQVFTATGNKNSVNVVLTSGSGKKGTVKVTNVVVNTGTNVVETITFTGIDSGDGKKATFTSSAATSALSSITTDASAFSVSSGKLSWTNGKKVILTAESNIKYVAFSIADGKMYNSFSAAETTYNSANYSWSGSSKTVTLTNGSGGGREIKGLYVIIDPVVKHHVTYSLGGDYGTTPTQADVAEGAKFTLHNGTTGITAPSGKQFAGWNDGSSTYAGGAEYTMGTSNVTLTAVWENAKTDPTATFSAGAYVVGESALDLSTLWSSNSDGAVTYALKVASEDATVSGTSFSATKTGSYVVTASQAATATYNAVEKEATITVTVNPLGTHTITYTLSPINTSDASLTSTQVSTSTYLKNLTTINASLCGFASSPSAGKNRTAKINRASSEKDNDKYVYLSFDVESGYQFTPTSIVIKVANVSNATTFDASLISSDGPSVGEDAKSFSSTDGTVETWTITNEAGTALTGTVTLKIWPYAASAGSFRFGTPITITGTVAAKPTPTAPSISAPTADSEAEYDLGSTITALEVTATGYPAPAYQWYKNDTKTTEGATAIDGAESANYTPANDAASDFYYYCVATNASGSATSHFFHVTVNSCTPPTAPASLGVDDGTLTYNSATLSWDGKSAGAHGYVIALTSEAEGATGTFDWKDEPSAMYVATGLKQETEYTFKVKYKGDAGECEYSEEVTKTFTTTVPTVADLVTIDADYTFTPSAALTTNTLYEEGKIISLGGSSYNNGIQIKTNRQIAFKVSANAKIKVTFNTKDTRELQIGTTSTGTDLAHSPESPISAVRAEAGIVYLSASSDLYMTKLEIFYPKTVTYALGDGSGTPTESAHYEGDKFTVHNGVTGITAPSGQEFDKWKDQDNADVAGGAEYTMPAKAVTLTAQWRAETVKYTVTYDLADYTAGVAPTETNKAAGDVFAIKAAPSRDGYAFMGWLCNIDAQTYQATDDYTMTAAATTFTAVWKQEFQVTYNLQGHGDPIAPQIVVDGAKVTKPADPEEMLYEFGGWYKEAACTNAWDFDNDLVTTNTELFAKWTEFDGCAYLAPAASGDALHIGDNVNLKSGSLGGTLKVANMKTEESTIQYNGYGLYFGGGVKDSLRVTINNQMQVGTKITVALRAGTNGTSGLKLITLGGTEKAALGWTSATNGDEGTFSYTVTAGDGLEGTKAFRLQRNGSVYLKYVSVENCAPQDFTVTYKDGESTTLGTEDVIENEHPTATGIATRKQGFVFQGWAETNGGSVVDLNDIVITADKTLYAVYTVRVCATSGSMFKFQMKTDLTNGNVFASAPNSVAATTTNYLAELAGGEVTFAVTGTSNNNLLFYDQKAIGFANGSQGRITINLDCPLAEGDEIRFINYNSSGQKARLSDGSHNLDLNGNGAETVQQIAVPADFVGAYELTITRANNTPKITYFEIYRCPAVTGVSVAELTVREGASVTPVMTLAPSDDALVTKQAWSILSGDDKITINPTTGVVTGVHEGDAVIKVVLNDDPTISATATVHVVETFVQQDVTESIVWDFSKAGTASAFTDQVLANVNGVTLDVTQFDARKLVGTANNITSTYFQGTMLTFNATTAGKLSVRFTNGNSNVRTLKVYAGNPEVEIASWSYSNAATENKSIDVPAGKVTLRSYQGDAPNNVRIMNLEFYALAHQRTTGYNVGDLGTVCLEDETFIEGANLYELAGLDEHGYLAFDQVDPAEQLEAGKPYLFEVTNPSKISFYKPVGAAHRDSEIENKGMIGTFSGTILYQNVAQNYYYFSGRHIWKVNDFTVAIPIPGHRCYIDYDVLKNAQASPNPAPGRRRVTLGVQGTQVTTDINNVGSDDVQCTKVMIDGQLYILRGEKMYDATGRLVK